MVTSPAKRLASASPDTHRLPKRPATSSPEEGELDDQSPHATLPSKNPPPAKQKIPFPFKKKPEPVSAADNDSDVRFARVADARRRAGRGIGRPSLAADHWDPSYGTSSSRLYPPQRWDSYPPRDYRDRERGRTSPPQPSRSPSSGSPSGQREKHRLPVQRAHPRDVTPSPPRNRDRRYRDDRDERHYHPGDAEWHDRRDYPYRRVDERRGGRRESSYEYDHDRFRYDERDRGRRMGTYWPSPPRYAPASPRPPAPQSPPQTEPPPPAQSSPLLPPRSPASSQPPIQPTENGQIMGTPPPPTQSPPPAPPPDERLFRKNDMLPDSRTHVAIPLKRPGAPKGIHSPPSILLHVPPAEKDKEKDKEKGELKVRPVRTREVVRRTRKEEMEAYGRRFVGCGEQSDYEVTTKLGEGTFGEVHKAIQTSARKVVALKRILMHNEKEGMPVTALREIKILKGLKHPCIVDILDMFVVRSNQKDPLSVYMVFPYMDHDLAGLLENERVKLQPSHIKLYMKQLLEGTEYMHRNHILHRDMKAANLLISNNGSLKIADFGLARSYDPNVSRMGVDSRGRERRYTNCVVTRWYRPPELLLGARHYGGEVDIWGIGCVLGEMFNRRPILPGTSDLDQLEKIWQLCGTPNQHSWPNFDALPGCEGVKRFQPQYPRRVKQAYESVGPETCDLLDKLLVCNPRERITAAHALDHEYFWTDPLPADPKTLPSYEASHEFDKRGHRNQHPPPIPPHHHHHVPPPPLPPHIPPGHHPPHHLAHGSYRPPPPPHGGGPAYHYASGPGRPPPLPLPPYGGPGGPGRGVRRPPPPPPGGGPGYPFSRPPPHLPAKPSAPMGRDERDRERDWERERERDKGRERERERDERDRRDGRDGRERDGRRVDRNGFAEEGGGELNYG